MPIFLENQQDIKNLVKKNKSKLESMKDQLEILLRKKVRLELEIKTLKKAINNRVANSEKQIKVALNVENCSKSPISAEEQTVLLEQYPEVYQAIAEFDSFQLNLNKMLEDYQTYWD